MCCMSCCRVFWEDCCVDSVWRWNEVVCMGLHNARGGVRV